MAASASGPAGAAAELAQTEVAALKTALATAAETARKAEESAAAEGDGHLGYTGHEGGNTPAITLTRPGTVLPEHKVFGAGAGNATPTTGYYQTIIPLHLAGA